MRLRSLLLSAAVAVPLVSAQSVDELKEKNLLMGVDLVVKTGGAHAMGEKDAKVTIVEFFDYQCPYCGVFADQTLAKLLVEYVKTGKVRYIVRNFPQEKIHPFAPKAAEMGECAGEQGKYWEAHLRLLKDQQTLETASMGLDQSKFQECLDSGRAAAKVKSDLEEGRELKVPGTPSFYFGYSDPADPLQVRAVKLLVGSHTFKVFEDVIGSLLNPPPGKGETHRAEAVQRR